MAAVEHAMLAGEQVTDGNRNQASSRFTAVNSAHSSHTRTTSFRPDPSLKLAADFHQYSPHKHNGSLDQFPNFREAGAPAKDDAVDPRRYSQPGAILPSPTLKRKRSLEPASSGPPDHSRSQLTSSGHPEPLDPSSTQHNGQATPSMHSHGNYDTAADTKVQHAWPQSSRGSDATSEANLAESMQKDMRPRDTQSREEDSESPVAPHMAGHPTSDNGSHSQADGTPSEGKKLPMRKRNFSQRTKTGCHTCRERKKKCDEAKPICNNCHRGNFQCKGYGPKNELDARVSKPPPLQSKPLQRPPPPVIPAPPIIPPVPTTYYTPPVRVPSEPWMHGQTAGVAMYDHHARPAVFEPDPTHNHTDWGRPAATLTGPEQSHEQRYPLEQYPPRLYNRRDMPAITPRYSSYAPMTNASHSVESAAHLGSQQSGTVVHMTEKQKMLTGKPYLHYIDPKLIEERNLCRASLERFNNACRPSAGASNEERSRLFHAVVTPDYALSNPEPGQPSGRCGSRVLVEAPFTCDYGYNINIGDDVVINAGCVMQDPCKISIGDRCIIGPNVKFYGMTMPLDPALRAGNQGLSYGGPIVIEDDCFIGGDVVILPNRRIRKGATVGAGTVVSKDVQASTVVAGCPMQVLRGLGASDDDQHKPHIQTQNQANIDAHLADLYGPRQTVQLSTSR